MTAQHFTYDGGLRCTATHAPSSQTITTDAPPDNNGRGEYFSPTDLVATALVTCIMTTMAIVAERAGTDLAGMTGSAEKIMATAAPRRIAQLRVDIIVPLAADHALREKLERAAHMCPVHLSLHPEIDQAIQLHWQGE